MHINYNNIKVILYNMISIYYFAQLNNSQATWNPTGGLSSSLFQYNCFSLFLPSV